MSIHHDRLEREYEQEYSTRKYHYKILFKDGSTDYKYYTEQEFDSLENVKDYLRRTDLELQESLRNNIDTE